MSVVSGVTLIFSLGEDDDALCGAINWWLDDHGFGPLKPLDDHYGGSKHPQINALGGGYNAFLEDEFAQFIMSREWRAPENVVLVIQPEEGPTRVFAGKGVEVLR